MGNHSTYVHCRFPDGIGVKIIATQYGARSISIVDETVGGVVYEEEFSPGSDDSTMLNQYYRRVLNVLDEARNREQAANASAAQRKFFG